MKFSAVVASVFAVGVAAKPTIYLIRHAEKNHDGTISARGKEREQCLIDVFGRNSNYNIQKIIAQNVYPGDDQAAHLSQRPYNTTLPLAESLGLQIETRCDYDDPKCAAAEARRYNGEGNILIAWEHGMLRHVSEALGADAPHYSGEHFDLIYNQPYPYDRVEVTSENCPGLD